MFFKSPLVYGAAIHNHQPPTGRSKTIHCGHRVTFGKPSIAEVLGLRRWPKSALAMLDPLVVGALESLSIWPNLTPQTAEIQCVVTQAA